MYQHTPRRGCHQLCRSVYPEGGLCLARAVRAQHGDKFDTSIENNIHTLLVFCHNQLCYFYLIFHLLPQTLNNDKVCEKEKSIPIFSSLSKIITERWDPDKILHGGKCINELKDCFCSLISRIFLVSLGYFASKNKILYDKLMFLLGYLYSANFVAILRNSSHSLRSAFFAFVW